MVDIRKSNIKRIRNLRSKGFKMVKTSSGQSAFSLTEKAAKKRIPKKLKRIKVKIVPLKVAIGKRQGRKVFAFFKKRKKS